MEKHPFLKKYARVRLTEASRDRHAALRAYTVDDRVSTMSALIHLLEEFEEPAENVASLSRSLNISVEAFRAQTNQREAGVKMGLRRHE